MKATKPDRKYRFKILYIDDDGKQKAKVVTARNEFEAKQIAEVFDKYIVEIINQDL